MIAYMPDISQQKQNKELKHKQASNSDTYSGGPPAEPFLVGPPAEPSPVGPTAEPFPVGPPAYFPGGPAG